MELQEALYSQLTDQVTKYIRVERRYINKVVKDFNACILTAAHKSIPRGARQNYKSYWSEELEDWMRNYLQPEGKLKPTHHKTITVTYNIPRPDFFQYKLQARRKSWRNKTASLNLEKSGLGML